MQRSETWWMKQMKPYKAVGVLFCGPKFIAATAMGMEETLSTVQLDFLLPERFDLTYVGEDGKNNHRPVVHLQ